MNYDVIFLTKKPLMWNWTFLKKMDTLIKLGKQI